jgi:hypothetical protein
MTRRKAVLAMASFLGVAVLLVLTGLHLAASPPPPADTFGDPAGEVAIPPADLTKEVIEGVAKGLLKELSGAANPKVEPGKVRWHPSMADACAAAQKSGKPVLLFQMMGKLDDQFC